eukprot:CAMPEP_0185019144 /NCGR_PEP_ID=MMETSP1103-20130426/1769_1 /TAXON_ID=36769 /ORGANISM="Paraphysomonas bandaiensis, Strain Caron Lab Isolate" /LENGTH=314 /DNA_ID=CAMNT_0027549301 /DNA_START=119 /DNA_END=1063 /DNA_ORIENTATION=+
MHFTSLYGDWIVLDISTSSDTCSADNTDFSIMKQIGVCSKVPIGVPTFESYKLTSCNSDGEKLLTTVKAYLTSDCSGFVTSFTYSELSTECHNGSVVSCQSDPIAVSEGWPAVGVYIEDSACDVPAVVFAANPGCSEIPEIPELSVQVECQDDMLSYSAYNTSDTCEGESIQEASLSADQCVGSNTSMPEPGPTSPDVYKRIYSFLHSDTFNIDGLDVWFYADCNGSDNIPGVVPSSTDDPSGNDDPNDPVIPQGQDDDTVGDNNLSVVEISLIVTAAVLVAVIALSVVWFCYYNKPRNNTEDLKQRILSIAAI